MSFAHPVAASGARALALPRVLVPLLAAVLTACGGGGSDPADGSSLDGVPAGSAADEPTATAGVTALSGSWTRVATEGQAFSVAGTQLVRYGSPWHAWVEKTVSGAAQCTNAFFGSDPAPGHGKACEVQGETATSTAPTTKTTTGTWSTIASEGQAFSVSGTQTVRYGNPWVAWLTATVSGAGTCSNAFFGSDPAPGKGKRCDVLAGATEPAPAPAPAPTTTTTTSGTWTQVASEGQGFSVSGTQTVRFGTRWVGWVERSMSGPGQCTNAFFGRDPAPGHGKVCEVGGAAAPSAPATSTATWSVIGSSTAAGVGATPGRGWVDLLRAANAARGVSVINLGVGGSVTYNGLALAAAVAGKPAPNTARNVDAAMAAGSKVVLINYPTNDVAYGYTSDETVGNHLSMRDSAARLGAVTIALSSQPSRGAPSAAQAATFADTDRRLALAFGPCFVPIRSALATSSDTLDPIYDSGDGQHLNDAGHALVHRLVQAVIDGGQCVTP